MKDQNKARTDSKEILGSILQKTFETSPDTTFDDLVKRLDDIPPCRETCLEQANERLNRLLNTSANTQLQ